MKCDFDPDTVELPSGHFIGGQYLRAQGAIELVRPSDAKTYAACPSAGPDLVDQAVDTARKALAASGWARSDPRQRANAMRRWADLIEIHAETLARLEALASTRPVTQAREVDVPVIVEQIRFFAEFADKEGGAVVPTGDRHLGMVLSEPYGVVGAITPWNVPVSMAAWKLGPALAAGNAIVLKPSELTPFSTLFLAELTVKAGIPAGIVNIVLGDGPATGAAIVRHPGIDKVSFTGSTRAGSAIMADISRAGIKPVTLELGGKSPQIVFADADIARAAACVAGGIMANAGQTCVAGSRLVVQASVADRMTDAVAAHMSRFRAGPTWEAASDFSPIISERQIARIEGMVRHSVASGARARIGGERLDRAGYFFHPTVIEGVPAGSDLLKDEIFGPVLTVETFDSEEEAVAKADHPTYGLAAGLHTRDLSRALRLTRQIQSGTVWVNRYGRSRHHILPTGGYKRSGIGKDLGAEAYHAHRRKKSVLIDLETPASSPA